MENVIQIPKFLDDKPDRFQNIVTQTNWNKINYYKRHISHYEFDCEEINNILQTVSAHFSRNVEGVFLNYYKDGNEYAPYHKDNYGCDVCLISLGTTRILRFKHDTTKENTDLILEDGTLLFIPNEIHSTYKHSLLKRTKLTEPRISILMFFE